MKRLLLIVCVMLSPLSFSHEDDAVSGHPGTVTYLGNTGLLVDHGDVEILFDPFFHNHYDLYQLVPAEIRDAIFSNQPPYDSVEMILISHAHNDHFDKDDLVKYLKANPNTRLLAPAQAVDLFASIEGHESIEPQITPIKLAYGDAPQTFHFDGIQVDVVRIPHAGWPGRAHVSNLVFRVTLNDSATVMHMGDADSDDVHFKPLAAYWEQQTTDRAFPPYWFMLSPDGQRILDERINAKHATGVHVPVKVPAALINSGGDYFHQTGKTHPIKLSQSDSLIEE